MENLIMTSNQYIELSELIGTGIDGTKSAQYFEMYRELHGKDFTTDCAGCATKQVYNSLRSTLRVNGS